MSKTITFVSMAAGNTTKEDLIQEQVLLAAKRLFAIHGLNKVTMDDVAKAIGKGRSSLYYYYKSKDEILDAVIQNEIKEMLTFMRHAVNEASSTEEKIKAFCIAKLEMLREKKAFFNTLDVGMDAEALSQFNQVKIMHHSQIIQQESELFEQIINTGTKNGDLRDINKAELSVLTFVMLSSLHGFKREMRLQNNFESIETVVNTFTRMFMHELTK